MTPPTRKRAGFLRRWPSSVAEGQPGPVEDVDCADVVRVRGEPAGDAFELRLSDTVPLVDVPACGARDRGVAGVHRDHEATGTLSLVRQDSEELPPTRNVDAAVQPGLRGGPVRKERSIAMRVGLGCGRFGHACRVQLLVGDHVVLPHQRQCPLVVEGGQVPLGFGQLLGHRVKEPGVGDMLAARVGGEVHRAHVDADDAAGRGQGLSRHVVTGEHHVPAVALALHRNRLDPALHGPVLMHPHVPHALETYPGVDVVRGGVPAAAVPIPWEDDGVEMADALEPGVSGLPAAFDPAEERLERLVQPPERRLLAGEGPAALTLRVERPDLPQLRGLIAVPDAGLRRVPPGIAALLQGPVVERTVVPQHLRQGLRLPDGGPQQELVRMQKRGPPPSSASPPGQGRCHHSIGYC